MRGCYLGRFIGCISLDELSHTREIILNIKYKNLSIGSNDMQSIKCRKANILLYSHMALFL